MTLFVRIFYVLNITELVFMDVMIEAKNLSRSFGSHLAVDDISFKVNRGEVLGFLGPNGAGKSTTMKMLTCFLTPSSGSASISGFDTQTQMLEVQRKIGYLPENAPIYGEMSVLDFLNFIGDIRGLKDDILKTAIDRVVAQTSLDKVLSQKIETLSKGFKRRVGLAQAIIHDPDVLILDEPTDGLDPNQKHEVRKLIQGMAKTKSIIVSTHILEEVDAICTRALIISKGKVVADGTPVELKRKASGVGSVVFDFSTIENAKRAKDVVSKLSVVSKVEIFDSRLMVVPQKSKVEAIRESLQVLSSESLPVLDVYSETAHLDEVFRAVTSSANS